jgi:hypothetical protein
MFSSLPFLSDIDEASTPKGISAAKFVLTPKFTATPFSIEFDTKLQSYSNNCLNSIKITYHALCRDDSEIFRIAKYGSVEELRYMLTDETARLTDRDTEGRSLLAVSKVQILFNGKANSHVVRISCQEYRNVQIPY